ncbi:MAG: HotDog domain-containing protein [Piptocephalis tieghemiana]|nr:MAG: HotDog domain-containing protein [Piptocephalis tieghemiana]
MFRRVQRVLFPSTVALAGSLWALTAFRKETSLEEHPFVQELRKAAAQKGTFEEHAADAHRQHHSPEDRRAHLTFSTLRSPEALPVPPLIFHRTRDSLVLAIWRMGKGLSGYHPNSVHPGIFATMLDQTCGRAARMAGSIGFTARLVLDYEEEGPSHPGDYVVESWVDRVDGRKVWLCGEIRELDSGRLTARGHALFLRPKGQ